MCRWNPSFCCSIWFAKKIEVIIRNGQIVFNIPANWVGATRFEVFDENGILLVAGDLNRTGAVIPKFEKYELDEAAQRRYWYFTRRLHNPLPKWFKLETGKKPGPDVVLDPDTWRPGQTSFGWSPVCSKMETTKPESLYSKAKNRLDEVIGQKSEIDFSVENSESYSRELLNSLDILIEATFYAGLYADNKLLSLAILANDLCELMNLPCGNQDKQLSAPNIAEWKPHFKEPLEDAIIEKWKEYGPKLSLDVGLLFNYWIYLQHRGIESLESRGYDAIFATNKYYQIWEALRKLVNGKVVNASRERVFDSRIDVLSSYPKAKVPSNVEELERFLKFAFDKCRPRLKN